MRRPIAIFFLVLVLFNIAGYYLVFEGWKWHNSVTWTFEENHSGLPELIIEVPLSNPQYASQEGYWESTNQPFEYNGEVYRIIKKRSTLNALYIECVKDNENSRINDQLKDYANTFTDKPLDGKQDVKHYPGFIKEYVFHSPQKNPAIGWCQVVKYFLPPQSMAPSFFASIVHPPERNS